MLHVLLRAAPRPLTFLRVFALLLMAATLGGASCATFEGLGSERPLSTTRIDVADPARFRTGAYYRLDAAGTLPRTARFWQARADWEALPGDEKVDAIEAERRRGNVIIVDGDRAYFMPEMNLAKPGKVPVDFVKPEPK